MDRASGWFRRRVLASSVGIAVGGLAGCSEGGPPPGLHAVSTTIIYRSGGVGNYPTDVTVRVTVENTAAEANSGTLVVELRHETEAGEEEFSRRQAIDLPAAITRSYLVTFRDVFESVGDVDSLTASSRIESSE